MKNIKATILFLFLSTSTYTQDLYVIEGPHCTDPETSSAADLAKCITEAPKEFPAPSEADIKKLKFPTFSKNHEDKYKEVVLKGLKDPDSAKFRGISKPFKFWGKNDSVRALTGVCGEVNAKNSYGGYTGYSPNLVIAKSSGDSVSYDTQPLSDFGALRFIWTNKRYPCRKK